LAQATGKPNILVIFGDDGSEAESDGCQECDGKRDSPDDTNTGLHINLLCHGGRALRSSVAVSCY